MAANLRKDRSGTEARNVFQNLSVLLLAEEAAAETSIAVPGEKVFLMIAPGKADFRIAVPAKAVFQRTGRRAKEDSHTTAPPGKEAPARNALLTESRAQGLAGSATETSLFSVTGKVPGRR